MNTPVRWSSKFMVTVCAACAACLSQGCGGRQAVSPEGNSVTAKPAGDEKASRPKLAILGHWRVMNDPRGKKPEFYVQKGSERDFTFTWIFDDGTIEEKDFAVDKENATEFSLTLVRWYRPEETREKKNPKMAVFSSDGRKMIEKFTFSPDRKTVNYSSLYFDGNMKDGWSAEYVDAKQTP